MNGSDITESEREFRESEVEFRCFRHSGKSAKVPSDLWIADTISVTLWPFIPSCNNLSAEAKIDPVQLPNKASQLVGS